LEHPYFAKYGGVALNSNAAFQPDLSLDYKVLFDIRETSNDAAAVNEGLDHVAKLLNFLAPAGIKIPDASIIAIVHGPAIVAVLKDQIYREKFGMDNPNNALIKELVKSDVKIYACVQALTEQKIDYISVHDEVSLALSSLMVMINCQLQNYAYVPFN
jgi:intracellular sulfur oxidation DsrE/DsrF family protein